LGGNAYDISFFLHCHSCRKSGCGKIAMPPRTLHSDRSLHVRDPARSCNLHLRLLGLKVAAVGHMLT
jgi:hypothetical protein